MANIGVRLVAAMAIASPLAAQVGSAPTPSAPPPAQAMLAAGTPVIVMLDQELTTTTNKVGEMFQVTVLHDVVDGGTVVIPQGSIGHGEITFVTKRGGFGKAGIIGIALRDLDLGDRKIELDGHYREEGKNRGGATVATWVAVGVFSGFIKGNEGAIPKGRELKARTGEAIAYTPDVSPTSIPVKNPESVRPPDAPQDIVDPATQANNATRLSQAVSGPSGIITTTGEKE